MSEPSLETFSRAFDERVGSYQRTCECGRTFYTSDGLWGWDEGELETLRANPRATPLEGAVSVITFEGRYYVTDCDCWQTRAMVVKRFLDHHAAQIAEYLTLERTRKQAESDVSPVVGGPR